MGASTLPDPIDCYRRAMWLAVLGWFTTIAGIMAVDFEQWGAQASLFVPCLAILLYARWRITVWSRTRQELGRWTILRWRAEDDRAQEGIYLGSAFALDQPHAQRLANLMSEPWSVVIPHDAPQRALPGDTRPWAVGADEAHPYLFQVAELQHMSLGMGGTGCGKSTLLRLMARAGIRHPSRPPVFILDPKGDRHLRNEAAAETARAGRRFLYISLYFDQLSATYNPILRCDRPEDRIQRFDAVIPHQGSSSPAFRDNPIAWATTVCTAVEAVADLLQAMGGSGTTPPPVLRALAWVRDHPDDPPAAAIAAAADPASALPSQCAPAGWPIDIFMVPDWVLARPQVLMAWILRLAHPAALEQIPLDPNAAPPEERTGPALLAAWAAAKPTGTAAAVWAHFRPGFASVHADLVKRLGDSMRDLLQIAGESTKNRSTVGSALSIVAQTLSRIRRIIATQQPDIDMEHFCNSDDVLYVECASMALGPVARMFGRLILGDLAGYLGERNARGQPGKPVWLIVDELAEVINQPLLQLVAMGRAAGVHALFLTQDRAGLIREIGKEGAEKFLANMNGGLFQFYTNDREDADRIVRRAGQVHVDKATTSVSVSGTNQGPHDYQVAQSTSFGRDQQTYLAPDAVMRLPVGCCVLYQGGRLHVLKVAKLPDPTIDYLASRGITSSGSAPASGHA